MPSVDSKAVYPASAMMGGPTRAESPDRNREIGGPPSYGRGGQPPAHSYSYPPPWGPGGGPYGHPIHGPQPVYHPHQGAGIADGNTQQGPPPGYPQPSQQYPMTSPATYPPQHQQLGSPPSYGPLPPHMYGYGMQHRPGPWGYGVPGGYDPQQHRYGFSHQNGLPPHMHQQSQNSTQNLQQSSSPGQQTPTQQSATSVSSQFGKQKPQPSGQKGHSEVTSPIPQQISSKPNTQPNPAKTSSSMGPGNSKNTNETKLSSDKKQPQHNQFIPSEDIDMDRQKAAAAVELTLAEVKPIQSDFHFFVHEMREKLEPIAAAELDKTISSQKASIAKNTMKYTFLLNSNLNCRLLREWENLTMDQRSEYMKKEEEDRRRFMDEDEVASRHCFTLTARVRSPSKTKSHLNAKGGDIEASDNLDDFDDEEDSKAEDDDENFKTASTSSKQLPVNPVETDLGLKQENTNPVGRIIDSSRIGATPPSSKMENVATVSPKSDEKNHTMTSHDLEKSKLSFTAENIVTPPAKKDDIDKCSPSEIADTSDVDVVTPRKGVAPTTSDGAIISGEANTPAKLEQENMFGGDAEKSGLKRSSGSPSTTQAPTKKTRPEGI